MIVPAHHFWCYSQLLLNSSTHVAWSATGFLSVIRIPHSRDAKVCHMEIAIVVKDKVFRLDISMDDAIEVNMF